MTTTVKRYTQPCVQTQPGPEFKVAEVPLFEDPNGKWVRYEDIKHLLRAEPPARPTIELTGPMTFSCTICGTRDEPQPCHHVILPGA